MVKDTGESDLEKLERQMAEAAADMRFEDAAFLRNEIARLKGEGGLIGKPALGHMGLGTDRPIVERPKNWTPPKKPDPMTRGHRPGGRSRSRQVCSGPMVVIAALRDLNAAFDLAINKAMFVVDAPRPPAGKLIPQRLRLADP